MSDIGIVVACHGQLAGELIASAELIAGAQEAVTSVSLNPQDNLETMQTALLAAIDSVEGDAGVMVLIDLFGGTPGNAAAMCWRDKQFPLISGVNLPMLLEVVMSRDMVDSVDELGEIALRAGQTGILDVAAKFKEAM